LDERNFAAQEPIVWLEEYKREIENAGITSSIFMETSPDDWREEANFVYGLAASDTVIGGVIANCRPEEAGFEAYLETIQNPKLVGLRRICHVEPDELSQQTEFVRNVQIAGERGLTFDLCFLARQLPLGADLARKCPNVQFVLDHCGVPNIAANALDSWGDEIRKIAALPNVACKISGVMAYCNPGEATTQTVRPYVEHCLESFGADRVVWGSDWPVCNTRSTLKEWVKTSREIVESASETEQHKLFHLNAERVYRLKS
jgi:predicted TIM-barrel fold metal-dependent hydrolase